MKIACDGEVFKQPENKQEIRADCVVQCDLCYQDKSAYRFLGGGNIYSLGFITPSFDFEYEFRPCNCTLRSSYVLKNQLMSKHTLTQLMTYMLSDSDFWLISNEQKQHMNMRTRRLSQPVCSFLSLCV